MLSFCRPLFFSSSLWHSLCQKYGSHNNFVFFLSHRSHFNQIFRKAISNRSNEFCIRLFWKNRMKGKKEMRSRTHFHRTKCSQDDGLDVNLFSNKFKIVKLHQPTVLLYIFSLSPPPSVVPLFRALACRYVCGEEHDARVGCNACCLQVYCLRMCA